LTILVVTLQEYNTVDSQQQQQKINFLCDIKVKNNPLRLVLQNREKKKLLGEANCSPGLTLHFL
jgi:hypothetical protein